VRQSYSKTKVGRFLRHGVLVMIQMMMMMMMMIMVMVGRIYNRHVMTVSDKLLSLLAHYVQVDHLSGKNAIELTESLDSFVFGATTVASKLLRILRLPL